MGTKSSKLKPKDIILKNILVFLYDVDYDSIYSCDVLVQSDIISITANLIDPVSKTLIHKIYHQNDGQLTDILYSVLNMDVITDNPYTDLDTYVKAYNEHIILMRSLEKQGLY